MPGPHDAVFDIRRSTVDASGLPADAGRIVYDSDLGEVRYHDRGDRLTIMCERAAVDAELAARTVAMRYATGRDDELALLAHPLFTLPLLELLKRTGRYSLHASCVAQGDRGLLIAGPSGSGKTTLSIALACAGLSFLSDDMVFLDPGGPELVVLAFPDELDVTDDTARRFEGLAHLPGRATWGGRPKHQVRAEETLGAEILLRCRPGALVLPQLHDHVATTIEPCSAAEALVELVPNVLLTEPTTTQHHLDALGLLARTTPVYRAQVGTDHEQAAAAVRALVS
jgi:hypothetical protein